jgi:hypothetical protein
MAWLISFRFRACYKATNGISRNQSQDTVYIEDVPPAEFILRAKLKLMALEDEAYDPSKGPQRADEIEIIYSAFEVTDKALIAKLKDNL